MKTSNSLVAQRQRPLRQAFRKDPTQALSYKEVHTHYRGDGDALHGRVRPAGFPEVSWDFGIDGQVGGYADLPNPGHLLCGALAACLDSTVRMIADHMGVPIERLDVEVKGDVDVRGCLAMTRSVRPGFRYLNCHLDLELDPAADPQLGAKLVQQAEALCVTLDTIRHGTPINVSFNTGEPVQASATSQL